MVRFIIHYAIPFPTPRLEFTFHYGQIYYTGCIAIWFNSTKFTFHYGQIYYPLADKSESPPRTIYIPLWLDLLCRCTSKFNEYSRFTFHYGQIYYEKDNLALKWLREIYIPLWLDLLFRVVIFVLFYSLYLHSTMVRFII